MKAIRIDEHGGRERLACVDAPLPKVGRGDVLVEVHAAAVNPIDWKMREGMLKGIVDFALPHVMGRDLSGTVAAIGEDVRDLAIGEAVYGTSQSIRDGSHAEFVAVDRSQVARRPDGLSHVEAAALPVAGLSALEGLTTARLAAGERVLVHSGAGGVGSLAIQIARHIGAEVATTASAGILDYVRSLGATTAIDYAKDDFAAVLSGLDVVFDLMGGAIHRRSYKVLKPRGRLAWLNADPIEGKAPRKDVETLHVTVSYDRAWLERLTALVEAGGVRPQVATTFPLAEAAAAYDLSQSGHVRGKIVLEVR